MVSGSFVVAWHFKDSFSSDQIRLDCRGSIKLDHRSIKLESD